LFGDDGGGGRVISSHSNKQAKWQPRRVGWPMAIRQVNRKAKERMGEEIEMGSGMWGRGHTQQLLG